MSAYPHSIRRRGFFHEFFSVGIWVGVRIFMVPAILFVGYHAFGDDAKATISNRVTSAIAPLSRALSLPNGSYGPVRSIFTPNPGAKWVRP